MNGLPPFTKLSHRDQVERRMLFYETGAFYVALLNYMSPIFNQPKRHTVSQECWPTVALDHYTVVLKVKAQRFLGLGPKH